jgi:hypothetical protein
LICEQGLNQPEVLESGASVSYAWDDLALPHKLVVTIAGILHKIFHYVMVWLTENERIFSGLF